MYTDLKLNFGTLKFWYKHTIVYNKKQFTRQQDRKAVIALNTKCCQRSFRSQQDGIFDIFFSCILLLLPNIERFVWYYSCTNGNRISSITWTLTTLLLRGQGQDWPEVRVFGGLFQDHQPTRILHSYTLIEIILRILTSQ